MAAAGSDLAASYAAVQSNLRKQFYGDLVELRGALLNTMNQAPHRAGNLHLKMHLIDSALHMLEETKASVTNAEMAQLMNMSAKVARAVEAWRARKPSIKGGVASQHAGRGGAAAAGAAAECGGGASSSFVSPFGAPEAQQAAPAGLDPLPGVSGADRFDAMSKLITGPEGGSATMVRSATTLPEIDWDVPEVKPSGNLDALLPSEASEVLLQQQRAVQRINRPQRMSSAEVFLARMSAHADDSAGGAVSDGGGPAISTAADSVAQQQSAGVQGGGGGGGNGGGNHSMPPPAAYPYRTVSSLGRAEAAGGGGGGYGLTSPTSAATQSDAMLQQEGGSNNNSGMSGGHSGGGCVGGGAAGTGAAALAACMPAGSGTAAGLATSQPLAAAQQPAALALHPFQDQLPLAPPPQLPPPQQQRGLAGVGILQQQQQQLPFGSGVAGGGSAAGSGLQHPGSQGVLSQSPFGSTIMEHHSDGARSAGAGMQGMDVGASGFGSMAGFGSGSAVLLPQQQPKQGLQQAQQQQAPSLMPTDNQGFMGGMNPSLQPPANGSGVYMYSNGMSSMQLLGNMDSNSLPPLMTSASFGSGTLLAQQQQQAAAAGRLSALQQFPQAALHAGSSGLQQLLGGPANGGSLQQQQQQELLQHQASFGRQQHINSYLGPGPDQSLGGAAANQAAINASVINSSMPMGSSGIFGGGLGANTGELYGGLPSGGNGSGYMSMPLQGQNSGGVYSNLTITTGAKHMHISPAPNAGGSAAMQGQQRQPGYDAGLQAPGYNAGGLPEELPAGQGMLLSSGYYRQQQGVAPGNMGAYGYTPQQPLSRAGTPLSGRASPFGNGGGAGDHANAGSLGSPDSRNKRKRM